uniref:Signal recognition particle 14 kDa protein n=1 Tax=Gopherus agassizii TaxID=38772 RepID=A0A452HEC8_9SAUR
AAAPPPPTARSERLFRFRGRRRRRRVGRWAGWCCWRASRTSGSVYITLKKYDGRTKPIPRKGHVEGFEPADNKCLLRATDGKKKISTVVSSKEVNKFQMAYSNLLRANMDGLKKKDKKSKNK